MNKFPAQAVVTDHQPRGSNMQSILEKHMMVAFSTDKHWRKVPTHCNPLNPVSCAKGLISTGEWADSVQRDTLSLNDSVDVRKWLCFHLPSREGVKCYACDEEMRAQREKHAANVSAAEI